MLGAVIEVLMMNDKFTIRNFINCPDCSKSIEIEDRHFELYFNSQKIICSVCKANIDLWTAIKKQLDLVPFGWHYSLLGCIGVSDKILLKPNEISILDLSKEIGGGELLYINYTPVGDGGLFPIQMHSNTPISHIKPKIIRLFPRASKDGDSETIVQIFYWFATEEIVKDLSSMLILDAFQRFYEKNYRYMLVSAQTSIEVLQYKLFENLLNLDKKYKINKERIENFLEQRATYSSQLFTLLPFVANITNIPIWKHDSPICEGLKILGKGRNDAVHRGLLELNEGELKKALLGAFFAYKYFKIIHKIS